MRRAMAIIVALAAATSAAAGGTVIEHWGADGNCAHPETLKVTPAGEDAKAGPWTITVDLKDLPAAATVRRASLLAEREPVDGREDSALIDVRITAGDEAQPLKLIPPWFAGFDATRAVRGAARARPAELKLSVKAFPGWRPEATRLEIVYDAGAARADGDRPRVADVKALHRAGQTFITFKETDDLLKGAEPTWGKVRAAMAAMGREARVRYLVFRHTEPITGRNIADAALLARVKPLSAYNVRGRSVEELIATIRRRAMDDIALSRKLARQGLRYNADSPEMDEVMIKRLAITDGQSLPAGTGLYVHQPARAGKAHYAVVAAVNGTADLGNPVSVAVEEKVGPGEPVRQPAADVTVFYDYPGQRRQYVQWTAPPLSNLPNQYYNWSLYVPRDRPKPTPVRMAFTGEQFIKPGVRHRDDTILVSGQDAPLWSQWYGYHEAMGTLKSFRQGRVHPYTRRRLFAFLDWVVKTFDGDAKRLSCVGETPALYYGVRHGDRFAYVLTHAPDPNPKVTPAVTKIQAYRRRRPRPQRQRVWGKVEWKVPGENGKPVWDHFDLIEYVKDPTRDVTFLSMGPAMLSAPWTNQVTFMKQLWASKYGFCARFYWGGGKHLPIPEGRVGAKDAFDFALDIPFLALRSNSNDRGLDSRQFKTGRPAYGSGGRIADGRRWLADFVDEPDRFEITIHGYGRVTYRGGGTSDVTIRRTRKFKPEPGEAFTWENVPLKPGRDKPQAGEVVADEHGLVTLPQVRFHGLSRLKVVKKP